MNWYMKYKYATIAQQVGNIFSESLEMLDEIVNQVYVTVNSTKSMPGMARYVADANVAKMYIRFENAARKIPELIRYKDINSAKTMLSQALQYVKQLCGYMKACSFKPFVDIDENLSNINIILSNLDNQSKVNINVMQPG